MTIYFIQETVLLLFGVGRGVNSDQKKRKRYVWFAFFILLVVAALRKYTVGADLYGHYANRYEQIARTSWKSIPAFQVTTGYTLGYCYYCKLLTCISSNIQFFIFATSLIVLGITCWFIYRNSKDVVLSINLFVLYCINYMYFTMLRQALAVSLLLIGYEVLKKMDLGKKRFIYFAIICIISATFHTAAILCLLFIPLSFLPFRRKQIIMALLMTIVAYFFYSKIYHFVVGLYGSYSGNYDRYLTSILRESHGNFNMQSLTDVTLCGLAFLFGFYELVWKKRRRTIQQQGNITTAFKHESFLLYASLLAFICRFLVFRMNIIYRYSYFFIPFVLVLIPEALSVASVKNRRILRTGIYAIFGFFFVYMTINYAQAFYRTVPYEFFWR